MEDGGGGGNTKTERVREDHSTGALPRVHPLYFTPPSCTMLQLIHLYLYLLYLQFGNTAGKIRYSSAVQMVAVIILTLHNSDMNILLLLQGNQMIIEILSIPGLAPHENHPLHKTPTFSIAAYIYWCQTSYSVTTNTVFLD